MFCYEELETVDEEKVERAVLAIRERLESGNWEYPDALFDVFTSDDLNDAEEDAVREWFSGGKI